MSDGGLRFHRVGKGLGNGRWEKGLSVEPRGLSPWGIILKYYSKRHVNIMFYPKFSFGKTSNFQMEGTPAEGMHVVAWVTSVNRDTCK
jgi:hypothetical protein